MTKQNKLIKNGLSVVTNTLDGIEHALKLNILSQGDSSAFPFPISLASLDVLVEEKKHALSDIYGVTITPKTKNKARDFICRMLLNLDSGYQQLKGIWIKETELILEQLKLVDSMPETLYMTFSSGESEYLCIDESADLSTERYGFNDENSILCPEDNPDVWRSISVQEKKVIQNIYGVSQFVASVASIDMGLGNYTQDRTYLRDQYGLRFIGRMRDDYLSFEGSDDVLVAMLTRPANIEKCITHFEKKVKALKGE